MVLRYLKIPVFLLELLRALDPNHCCGDYNCSLGSPEGDFMLKINFLLTVMDIPKLIVSSAS